MTLYLIGGGLLVIGGLIWALVAKARKSGKNEAVNEAQAEVLEAVGDAADVRRRLGDDPDYRDSVRDKFTRE